MDPHFGPLSVRLASGAAFVTIDHPPLNLVDGPFIEGLIAFLDALDRATGIRVVVFSSADRDFFLMHGDVTRHEGVSYAPRADTTANIAARTFDRLSRAPVLNIGVLDGAARGGGSEFFTALDLRFATPRSVLGQPEVPLGGIPGAGGTARLPRLIGRDRALELILTGRDVAADEALSIGWVTRLYPATEIAGHVEALARRVALAPAECIAAVKRVVAIPDFDTALLAETNEVYALLAKGVHRDPVQRFLAAGGQTREGERGEMARILDATVGKVTTHGE
jgi:enoyl-CoA hydratase/carnithine racemase